METSEWKEGCVHACWSGGSEYGVLTASFLHARAPAGHAPVHKYPSRRPISLFSIALFVSRLRHSLGGIMGSKRRECGVLP